MIGKRSSFATIITRAPSSTFAETGTAAFPRLRALLGTFPVVGLGDGAVLVVGVGSGLGDGGISVTVGLRWESGKEGGLEPHEELSIFVVMSSSKGPRYMQKS